MTHNPISAPDCLEYRKNISQGSLNAFVGVKGNLFVGIINIAYWKWAAKLALLGFVTPATLHTGVQKMKLRFAHCSFEAQNEAVVEIAKIINAIVIRYYCIEQAA